MRVVQELLGNLIHPIVLVELPVRHRAAHRHQDVPRHQHLPVDIDSDLAVNSQHRAARFSFITAALMIAQLVAAKATRDTLFLQHFPASELPVAMIGSGVVAVVGSLLMSRLLVRKGPVRVVPALFVASAMALVLTWLCFERAPRAGAVLVYLQLALFSPLLVSVFWTVLGERFDPHSAKRTVARATPMYSNSLNVCLP